MKNIKPMYAVTWEDAGKNSANRSRTPEDLADDLPVLLVTTVGHMTVRNRSHIVLSQNADHPEHDGEEWTYRDHMKIPRGMVREIKRLNV